MKVSPLSGNVVSSYLETQDFLITHKKFSLLIDKEWQMLLTHPVPEDLTIYYDSEQYKPHHHTSKSLIDRLYNFIRNRNYTYKLNIMKQYFPEGNSVLDYGTATGEFLYYLQQKSFEVSGVEPNKNAREQANKLLDNKVTVSIDDIHTKFDFITLWHVLEHVPNPGELINNLRQRLNPGGIILIAVPNFLSDDAQHYREYWAAYDVPRHLWHFSPFAMQQFMQKHQLNVIAKKPLFFDSFYVSLLSEEYKTGHKRILPAFWNGLKSNWKARKTGQYSSMIYVIKAV